MLEAVRDLFASARGDAVCITTNGFVKTNGEAVMGRGCAKEAADRWPLLPRLLAMRIGEHGVRTELLSCVEGGTAVLPRPPMGVGDGGVRLPYHLVAIPVKPAQGRSTGSNVVLHQVHRFPPGATVPGWAMKASMDLIERSARELAAMADISGWRGVTLPRPGCGAGELKWDAVREVLAPILDNRFTVVTKPR